MGMSMGGGGGGAVAAPLNLVQPSSDFAWFLQPAANYGTAWSYGGGSYGKTKGWGFWTRNSNSNFTGNRQDNFWGLMYNFSPTSTGSVWADDTEVTAGFRFEDFWLQNIAAGANVSGTPSYDGTDTTITASANLFLGHNINALLGVGGTYYRIVDVLSTTQAKVRGDASAATGAMIVWADYCEWHHIFGYIGQNTSGLAESGQRFVAGQLARQNPWMVWDYITDKSTWSDSLGVVWMNAKPEWYNATQGKNWVMPPYAKIVSTSYDAGPPARTTVTFDRIVTDSSITSLQIRIGTGVGTNVKRYAVTDFVDGKTLKVANDQRSNLPNNSRVCLVRARGSLELTNMYFLTGNSCGGLKIAGTDGSATGAVEIDTDDALYLGQLNRTNTIYMSTDVVRPGRSGTGAGKGVKYGNSDDQMGWWGATPVVKGTVTGSRGSNAALASLLTLLASYGLLTDSSS